MERLASSRLRSRFWAVMMSWARSTSCAIRSSIGSGGPAPAGETG